MAELFNISSVMPIEDGAEITLRDPQGIPVIFALDEVQLEELIAKLEAVQDKLADRFYEAANAGEVDIDSLLQQER